MYFLDCPNVPTEISRVKRSMDIFFICFCRGKSRDTRNETLFVVIRDSYVLRNLTSSFNIHQSAFDISLNLVFRISYFVFLTLFSYQIQNPPSNFAYFECFNHPEIGAYRQLLSFVGTVPALVGNFGVEQTVAGFVEHRDARTFVET